MAIIEVKEVVKQFTGHLALDRVSISVPPASVFGLLGPNGAGKTTLIRIINQITRPDTGQVLFKGERLHPKHVDRIGYLPEERGLYRKMKVGEMALYLAMLKGLTKTVARERLDYWFKKFQIIDWWGRKVEELSKGMQQKIQFIITIIHEPELLIFDEPFSGFDPINQSLLKEEILKQKERGVAIIFSTHNMSSVEEICDQIALIHQSKLVLQGPVEELRRSHKKNEYMVELKNCLYPPQTVGNHRINVVNHHQKDGLLSMRIKVEEDVTANEFIKGLMTCGEIHSFKEILPSMNDIFIQNVSETPR